MSTFNIDTLLHAVKTFDYIGTGKMIVPYSSLLGSNASITLLLLFHLFAFGVALGVVVWVTFFSGIILFKHLPKNQFGTVQSYLFPWYFRLTSFCLFGLIAAVILEQHNVEQLRTNFVNMTIGNTKPLTIENIVPLLRKFFAPFLALNVDNVQIGLLLAAYFASLVQQFILGPLTTKFMFQRHRLTDELSKPGKTNDAKLTKELKSVSGKFGAFHGISSLYNLFIVLTILAHGLYIATRVIHFATPARRA